MNNPDKVFPSQWGNKLARNRRCKQKVLLPNIKGQCTALYKRLLTVIRSSGNVLAQYEAAFSCVSRRVYSCEFQASTFTCCGLCSVAFAYPI
jgi:hypothetical protein